MVIQQLLGPNGLVCSTEDESGVVRVLWGGRIFYEYDRKDAFARRLGIALLGNLGVLKKTISEIFGVDRRTTRTIIALYQEEGVAGLRDRRQGRQAVSESLKSFVLSKYAELEKSWGYQQAILEAVEQKVRQGVFSKGISRSMLQKILREHKREMEREREREEAEGARQERAGAGRAKRLKQEEEEGQQQRLPEREPECVQHGGAAATIPLLQGLGFQGFLPQRRGQAEKLFRDSELAVIYSALNAAELVEVEQDFKLLSSYQMGGIIGRVKLPSLSLYRERIAPLVAQMDMSEVMVEAAVRAHAQMGFSKVLYIDGHFMPYYGNSATLYGYNSQRRLAMQGREYYFVHDEQGLPVYATISDGYRDMRHYIEEVDRNLRRIFDVGDKELVEVFDRGGYSKSFCVGIAQKIRFICWRSDAREVPRIPQSQWVEVSVPRHPNDYGESKVKRLQGWERRREMVAEGKTARLRELWIKDGRKVSPALSNDFQQSLPQLVAALTRRWGAQENMFKELKDHGIDRIHSYRKEPYTEQFLYTSGLEDERQGVIHHIGNPKIRVLDRQMAQLRTQKRRLVERIGRLEKRGKEEQAKELRRKVTGIDRRIAVRKSKRSRLPKKVRMLDRIEEEKIVRIADSKKLFFDWLKMNGIWAKRKLTEIVTPHYKDLRDVNKFVRSLLRSRTYVSRQGDALHVSFPPQRSPNARWALEAACEYLNSINCVDLGLSFSSIDFRVGNKH